MSEKVERPGYDYVSATGWAVSSGALRSESSDRTTILGAFQDVIDRVNPDRLGLIVECVPIGAMPTDDNTILASTESLLRDLGRWARPAS